MAASPDQNGFSLRDLGTEIESRLCSTHGPHEYICTG
jgi:hypothetical protein